MNLGRKASSGCDRTSGRWHSRLHSGSGDALRRRGRIGRYSRRVCLRAKILQANEDGDHDDHHDDQRLVVAATLLIGVSELCQKGLPILY